MTDYYLFMATKNGIVKKTPMEEYAECPQDRTWQAISLREDDELIEVKTTDNRAGYFHGDQVW